MNTLRNIKAFLIRYKAYILLLSGVSGIFIGGWMVFNPSSISNFVIIVVGIMTIGYGVSDIIKLSETNNNGL